jgi:hypothetical protein
MICVFLVWACGYRILRSRRCTGPSPSAQPSPAAPPKKREKGRCIIWGVSMGVAWRAGGGLGVMMMMLLPHSKGRYLLAVLSVGVLHAGLGQLHVLQELVPVLQDLVRRQLQARRLTHIKCFLD